jgi:hypothetical protein
MKNSELLSLLSFSLCLLSCNVFEPRDAEPPTQSGVQYLPFTDPSYVIYNLQTAIANTDVPAYMRCFADSQATGRVFIFNPSGSASLQFPTPWSLVREQEHFAELVSHKIAGGSTGFFPTFSADSSRGIPKIYNCAYTFVFQNDNSALNKPAIGKLRFELAPDNNGNWTIYLWSDFVDPARTGTSPTWTSYKEKFH